ncbi:MAG: peptide chain release factor N(5)-glutamine methyltransferase [Candidatus Kerfeldbacteria bacterium]|nr:peptide chain release factor N(5)-glutamine methyltransferase [Candidatus Kerfeldbacteria bacterium]
MRQTVSQLLTRAAARVTTVSDSPRLDAEVLLAFVLGWERTRLLAAGSTRISRRAEAKFGQLIQRRAAGTPVAYLTGNKEFFGLSLTVNPTVLIPRPATELLVEAVLTAVPNDQPLVVADIGTGSGAIALALAKQRPQYRMIATDRSLLALRTAASNAERLGLSAQVDFRFGSLLQPVGGETIDVIIANLPYLQPNQLDDQTIRAEPAIALDGGRDGLAWIRSLWSQVADRRDWRWLAIECDPGQRSTSTVAARRLWPKAKLQAISDGRWWHGFVVER